jgi:hypothetical protein
VWSRRLPPLTSVAAFFLAAVGARWCAPSRFVPESPVVPAITTIRGAVCRGRGVVFASVFGMRTVSVAATVRAATGRDRSSVFWRRLAESGVRAMDADRKRSDFRDPVCQL